MELKITNHSYYCNDGNYYKSNSLAEYDTWQDFKDEWFLLKGDGIDHDYNHCFRFDIVNQFDYETDTEYLDKFSLKLYYMLQRKGNFVPVTIKEITEQDIPEVEKYLKECWEYLKGQWEEFSKKISIL
jgi:hypothetical protein